MNEKVLMFQIDFIFASRTKVFQHLLEYFPRNMKEPDGSVMDSVKIL